MTNKPKTFIAKLESEKLEDGSFKEPERHGEIEVEAEDEKGAKAWVEQQNPGLKAISVKAK